MQRRKSPRKNQKQPDYYGIEGNQDRVEDNTLTLRARSSSKKKRQMGHKRSRQQLRAPSRKKTSSLSSSQSSVSESEERSDSDNDEKRPAVDMRHRGPQMAVTSSVNRARRKEYLPNDRRSLYSVCMKHLSIPKVSDPREIWGGVIVPAVRDKYQSKKCNMNNKIKSIYMSMRILFEYAKQYLLMQRPHKDYR